MRATWLLLLLLAACRVEGKAPQAALPASAAPASSEAPLVFVERVTGGADPADTLPLVIALHGLGDTPERFIALYADLPLKARVIAPRAPTPHGPGASWFPIAGGSGAAAREAGIRASAERVAAL